MSNKKNLYLSLALCASVLFNSCKKDDPAPTPTGITVQTSDIQNIYTTTTLRNFDYMDETKITMPQEGANKTWDFRNAKPTVPNPMFVKEEYRAVPANSGYSTASYGLRTSSALGVVNFNDSFAYYEVSASGWFLLGTTITAQTLNLPNNVTLASTGNAALYSNKITKHKLPLNYQDTYTSTGVANEPFLLTAPALGLTSATPATRRVSTTRTCTVTGWGKILLPDRTNAIDVLQVKVTSSETNNYLLAGSPAPAILLNNLGLTDGVTGVSTFYVYVSKTNGEVAEIGFDGNTVLYGLSLRP